MTGAAWTPDALEWITQAGELAMARCARTRVAGDLHVGTPRVFAYAGLVEICRPSVRRLVMRLDL